MLTFSSPKISINAVGTSSGDQTAFFVSGGWRTSSFSCCGSTLRWRRNFPAMRDQNFQELMSKHITLLPPDGPNSVSETQVNNTVGEAKPSIVEELDSQLSFRAFLKRSLPNSKPSPELIQSLKDRIKIIEFPDSKI